MPAVKPSDTDRSALRRIDDRWVPRLQRGVRSVAHALGWPARALRSVDERLAGGRPADAVREHRGLAAFLIVALAFGAVAVHAQRYPVLQERQREAVAGDGTPGGTEVAPGGDDDPGGTPAVGPLNGARVDAYLTDRRQALTAADAQGTGTAVLSFTDFLQPGEVVSVVGEAEVHRIQYRLPERTPRPAEIEIDDGDVATAVEDTVDRLIAELRAEEDEVASTLESGVEDEAFRADYQARLDELKGLRNTLTSDPAIVFAVVVEAPVSDLRQLADHEAVRLVDLAPAEVETDVTAFFGLLPSDQDRVSFGRSS